MRFLNNSEGDDFMAKLIDLTGQRFGKLVVIGRDMSRTNKGTYWLC